MEANQSPIPISPRVLRARAASGEYPIFIGRGLLDPAELRRVWPLDRAVSRPFCVSDETVWELYGERLGEVAEKTIIVPGESSKTLASAERRSEEHTSELQSRQ